jgi:hypothetical protein
LVLELGDDLVEDGVFLVSLGLAFGVHFSLVGEVGDGLLEGIFGLLEDDGGLSLGGKGGLDLLPLEINFVRLRLCQRRGPFSRAPAGGGRVRLRKMRA